MFIKVRDNIITDWADWAFDGSSYIEFDYSEYQANPDKYKYQNGTIIDISDTDEYKEAKAQELKFQRIEDLKVQLSELDKKRVRAICEPDAVQEDVDFDGTWLEYYNTKAVEIRAELKELEQ